MDKHTKRQRQTEQLVESASLYQTHEKFEWRNIRAAISIECVLNVFVFIFILFELYDFFV